jgi:hypothetical protein
MYYQAMISGIGNSMRSQVEKQCGITPMYTHSLLNSQSCVHKQHIAKLMLLLPESNSVLRNSNIGTRFRYGPCTKLVSVWLVRTLLKIAMGDPCNPSCPLSFVSPTKQNLSNISPPSENLSLQTLFTSLYPRFISSTRSI